MSEDVLRDLSSDQIALALIVVTLELMLTKARRPEST